MRYSSVEELRGAVDTVIGVSDWLEPDGLTRLGAGETVGRLAVLL